MQEPQGISSPSGSHPGPRPSLSSDACKLAPLQHPMQTGQWQLPATKEMPLIFTPICEGSESFPRATSGPPLVSHWPGLVTCHCWRQALARGWVTMTGLGQSQYNPRLGAPSLRGGYGTKPEFCSLGRRGMALTRSINSVACNIFQSIFVFKWFIYLFWTSYCTAEKPSVAGSLSGFLHIPVHPLPSFLLFQLADFTGRES